MGQQPPPHDGRRHSAPGTGKRVRGPVVTLMKQNKGLMARAQISNMSNNGLDVRNSFSLKIQNNATKHGQLVLQPDRTKCVFMARLAHHNLPRICRTSPPQMLLLPSDCHRLWPQHSILPRLCIASKEQVTTTRIAPHSIPAQKNRRSNCTAVNLVQRVSIPSCQSQQALKSLAVK